MIQFIIGKKYSITSSDEVILDYFNKNVYKIPLLNISTITKETATTSPCVLRLVKKLGYAGWKDFKTDVAKQLIKKNTPSQITIYEEAVKQLKNINSQAKLDNIVDKILQAEKVYIFGLGASGDCAKHAADLFNTVGKTTIHTRIASVHDKMLKTVTKKDVALLISYSGESREMLSISGALKKIDKISITKSKNNSLQQSCKENIILPVFKEHNGNIARLSYIMTLIIIDEIYSKLINRI